MSAGAFAPSAVPAGIEGDDGPLFGRSHDLATLVALLGASERLVTITGTAGVGKSRLGRAVLRELAPRFAGGALLCALADVRDAESLCTTVAAELGVTVDTGGSHAVDRVGAALARRGPTLVLLDDFDRAVESCAAIVGRWRTMAAGCALIVTSREALRVSGEQAYELGPLEVPSADADAATQRSAAAVQLVMDRAARAGHPVASDDVAEIAAIARQLEGLALALELTAARLGTIDAKSLRARLAAEPLEVLTRGTRDGAIRHRTLRGALASSWALLSDAEDAALTRCAVFRGGFDFDAAEAVVAPIGRDAPPVLDLLCALRDKSLLRAEPRHAATSASPLRLGMYLAVRELAAARLAAAGEETAAMARHASYYASLGGDCPEDAFALGQHDLVARLFRERENLDVVVERAAAGVVDAQTAVRALLAAHAYVWVKGSLPSHLARLDAALGALPPDGDALLRARALRARGNCRRRLGQTGAATKDFEAARELADSTGATWLAARALRDWGLAAPPELALDAVERACALSREAGDEPFEALAAFAAGGRLVERRQYDAAFERFGRALAVFERVGNQAGVGLVLSDWGIAELDRGHLSRARGYLERAHAIHLQVDNRWLAGWVLGALGAIAHVEGRLEESMACHEAALALARDSGDSRAEGITRGFMALVDIEQGKLDAARDDLVRACTLTGEGEPFFAAVFGAHLAVLDVYTGRPGGEAAFERAVRALLADASATRTHVELLRSGLDGVLAYVAEKSGDTQGSETRWTAARGRFALAAAADVLEPHDRIAIRVFPSLCGPKLVQGAGAASRSKAHGASSPPPRALVAHPDGRWLELPSGQRIDCSRRPLMRGLVRCLVAARLSSPGSPVSSERLIEAGWPAERIAPEIARNRLHVALTELRRLGLRELLRSSLDGYSLDPATPLELAPERQR